MVGHLFCVIMKKNFTYIFTRVSLAPQLVLANLAPLKLAPQHVLANMAGANDTGGGEGMLFLQKSRFLRDFFKKMKSSQKSKTREFFFI